MPIGDAFARMIDDAQRAAARPRPVPMFALNAYTPQGEQTVDPFNDWVSRSGKSAWAAAQAPGDIYRGEPTTTAEMVGPAAELARLVMGGTRMGAPAGAVGAGPVGGRRMGKSDFDRILAETRTKEAGTMARTGPEVNKMPAVIDSKGNVYEGPMHTSAINSALAAGAQPGGDYWPRGYVTNKGRFALREASDAGPNWMTMLLGRQ